MRALWKRYNEQVETWWYREGKLTPNYPVPAIRYEAWFMLPPSISIVVRDNDEECWHIHRDWK